MTAVRVFDPAMCCSTGICGPSIDPELVRFAADLDWLKTQGISVERFNLSQQPAAFAEDPAVRSALEAKGEAGLPLVKVNGEVKSSGGFPSRAELAAWAGLDAEAATRPKTSGCCGAAKVVATAPAMTEKVAERSGCCCGSSKAVEGGPATNATKPKSGGCC